MSSDERTAVFVDLQEAAAAGRARIAWSHQSDDLNLNLNLIVLTAGQEIEPHHNQDLDVLLVGVDGEGVVEVDGAAHHLRAGRAVLIPKGALRAMRATISPFAYLTCHGQRRGIQPQPRRR